MAFQKLGFILAGPSGSGKSTVVKLITRPYATVNRPQVGIFSLDKCRLEFLEKNIADPKQAYAKAFEYAQANDKEFSEYVTACWNATLANNHVVIVDNTNLTRKSRARWVNDLQAKKFKIVGIEVLAPLAVVIERQALRTDKSVPEQVVRDMYMRQEGLMLGTECDYLVVVDGTQDNSDVKFARGFYEQDYA